MGGKSSESSRSSTPPCPGIRCDESLTPASRFIWDSTRSPASALTPTSRPRMTACQGCMPRKTRPPRSITGTQRTMPAAAPSIVFLGLIEVKKGWGPRRWLTSMAPAQPPGVADDRVDDRHQQPGQPAAVPRSGVEEQVIVHRQPDVDGTRQPHRPAAEALPPPRDEEENGEAADQGQGQHQLERDRLQHGAAEGEVGAQGEEQPARRSEPDQVREPAELPQRRAGEHDHDRPYPPAAKQDQPNDRCQQQDAANHPNHQRGGFDMRLRHGLGSYEVSYSRARPSGRPPKRRTRPWYSERTWSRSATSKSGQSVSVTQSSA